MATRFFKAGRLTIRMNATEESFLDDLFDSLLAELLRGDEPDLQKLLGDHGDLLEHALQMLTLARSVVGTRSAPVVPGPVVRGYEVVTELGRGASSVVHLVRQQSMGGRLVALKRINPGLWADQRARQRFAAEVRALARVRHPNIVPVLDVVDGEDTQGYVMEWVRGQSLADLIRRRRDGTAADAADPAAFVDQSYVPWVCRLGVQLGHALQAVHAADFLHRDVKPSNVLIGECGEPLLSDFGLVRDEMASLQTRTGDFLGTLAYSSPEQLRGAAIDARSDVYGLAATLYHVLTGVAPGRGQNVAQVLGFVEGRGVPPLRATNPELPRDLETVIEKAMAVDVDRRYLSASAFADDLQRVLDLQPVHARPPGLGYRSARLLQRNRPAVLGSVLGAVLVVMVLVLIEWRQRDRETLSSQVRACVQTARLLMFDDQLIGRLQLQQSTGRQVDIARTNSLLAEAIAAYDHAVKLDPQRIDLKIERSTLAIAAQRLAHREPPESLVSEVDYGKACPTAWAYAQDLDVHLADDAAVADARALAVLAYLSGDMDRAIAALEQVERDGAGDEFVHGLLGSGLVVRGEPARALPRLVRVAESFPERGSLQAQAAAMAAECGDVALAQRFLVAARTALVPVDDRQLQRVLGDVAWLRGEPAKAEQHYQQANAYARLVTLWLARRQWWRAVIGSVNWISMQPKQLEFRRMLLIGSRNWWAAHADQHRDLLLAATAGELSDVGQLLGVMVGAARARQVLRTERQDWVPAISAPIGKERFEQDLAARSRDPFDLLLERMRVERLDLDRIRRAPQSVRESLVDAWLDPDGRERAKAIVQDLEAWLPAGADAFATEIDRPLVMPLHDVRELARPTFSQSAMWSEQVACLGGPTPRVVFAQTSERSDDLRGKVIMQTPDRLLVASIHGARATDRLGAHISNVGDINGDGYDDVSLGTAGRGRTGEPECIVLISGRDGSELHEIRGTAVGEGFGKDVIGLGDVNGDGTADIAVGMPQAAHDGLVRCGVVRVVGVDGRVLHEKAGGAAYSSFGQRLARVGDVDGDGTADFAVGTECQTPPLYAEVISGRTGALLHRVETSNYQLGTASVAGLGDVNGDRVADFVVGFATLDPMHPPAGHACILSGKTGEQMYTVHGDRPGEGFGMHVVALPDVDGDGVPELGVAASCEVSVVPPCIYVFSGTGRRLAMLPAVWRLLPLGTDGQFAAVTMSVWGRYAESPMASGARIAVARWQR